MMGATASIKQGDTVFQRYVLKRVLGVGGMGVVWLAQDMKLEQEIALKFVPEALQHDPDAINDLKNQTKLGLKLTHNNIVRVLGFEDDERLAAISMEYVDGATLAAMRVDQPAQVFEADSLHVYLLHILDALEYAHEQEKIVHRDLKPANVMVNSEDRVKVADFGIACSLRNSVGRVMSLPQRTGSGTLNYMSPQQLLGAPASIADDIYSLGATVFELMTGTPPFHSGDINMQIREIPAPSMAQRRAENRAIGEEIPPAWEEVVAAALAKDASLRPSNAAEFRKGLLGQPFRRGTGTGAVTSSTAAVAARYSGHTTIPLSAPKVDRSPFPTAILTAALVSILIVGGGLIFLNHGSSEVPPIPDPEPKIAVQRYIDQDLKATSFEKTEASSSAKREKWDRLLSDLRIIDYQAEARLREIVRRAEDRADYWKEQEDKEDQQYQLALQNLRSSSETARKECESRDLGAAAKADLWNEIVLKNAGVLSMNDKGTEHIALLGEARKQASEWMAKAKDETPLVPPQEAAVFAMSPAATWSTEGKKKLLQAVQTAMTQRGQPTGGSNGIWSPATFYALVSWQKAEKLPATGILDLPTLTRLGLHMMQEPSEVKVVTGGTTRQSSSPSGGSSSSGGSASWEDVAKMKVLQGGTPPMGRPPVPMFRP
ncbi:Serine/threonine protein kinase [Prosthecobacter debontii]|uniref:non-specific serine/threonine protein kinase n=2 Tax=Prosthecobacter debontii TaxID=48467 RepID=A0A1T4XNQ3_9BACT|nr:Serine/threonine protein kinase [Prosthecobacter debontii]